MKQGTRHVLSAMLIIAATTVVAVPASARTYDLVGQRVCLAGSWGEHRAIGWRVQLGVFRDAARGERLAEAMRRRGLHAETFIAAWLAGDDEPTVVVSTPYRSRAAAERAAGPYRRRGVLVRRFAAWSH